MSSPAEDSRNRFEGPVHSWDQPVVAALDRVEEAIGFHKIEWANYGFRGPLGHEAYGMLYAYSIDDPSSRPVVFRVRAGGSSALAITSESDPVDAPTFAAHFGISTDQARDVLQDVGAALTEGTREFNRQHPVPRPRQVPAPPTAPAAPRRRATIRDALRARFEVLADRVKGPQPPHPTQGILKHDRLSR